MTPRNVREVFRIKVKPGVKSESPPIHSSSFQFMANIPKKIASLVREHDSFRHVPNAERLSTDELTANGLYKGYPCPHGHDIRLLDNHSCYLCAGKIRDNICGFDLNYMQEEYKRKYADLWSQIAVGDPSECWEAPGLTQKRICLPSYRSLYARDKSTNVTAHKAIYQCAWGDVGALFVTRVCGNKTCLNPLHLVSNWNRLFPPSVISPFDYAFQPEKLMQYQQVQDANQLKVLRERYYKCTIQNPLVNQNNSDYDSEYIQYYQSEWQETS